jgi:hypothetical protein
MNEALALAIFSVPLLIFVYAALLEYQRDRQSLCNPIRALALGYALVSSIWLPVNLEYPLVAYNLSKTMWVLSLPIPVFALVCRYKSRVSTALIFVGGLLVSFLWLVGRTRE